MDDYRYFPEVCDDFNKSNLGIKIAGVRTHGTQIEFGLDSSFGVQWFPVGQCTFKGEHYLRMAGILGAFKETATAIGCTEL